MVSLSFHYGENMKKLIIAATALTLLSAPAFASRDTIHIVGSSTVYPFTTAVAEQFGKKTGNPTPVVESTGTGGGFKMFCSGVGVDTPDVTNASRPIKEGEKELCAANGVTPVETVIGVDAIVVARAAESGSLDVSLDELYRATAKYVIVDGQFVLNPNTHWSNKAGERVPMVILGPPPTSGTRDSFVELVVERACKAAIQAAGLTISEEDHKKYCTTIRDDGVYVEAGENDNLIVAKLTNNPDAFGIFGFSFLDGNRSIVTGVSIEGVAPEYETISSGQYAISRPLYVYYKQEHFDLIPNLREFMEEYQSEDALGEEGYLTEKGLVTLN
jgi:phosphate transport system substrate-binding protein